MKKQIILILVLLSLVIYGCDYAAPVEDSSQAVPATDEAVAEGVLEGDTEVMMDETADEEELTPIAEDTNGAMEDVTVEIEVTAKRFEFIPDPIRVNKGDHVKLEITSIDTAHGFDISTPFLSVSERLPVGEEVVIEFTATETGSWDYRCSVPCGSGHSSMKGTLIVE